MIPREFTIPIPTTCTTFTDIPKVWCDGKNLNYAIFLPQNLPGIIDYA